MLQSRPFVFFYVANQQNPFIPFRQPSSLSRSKIGYNALLSTSCGLKFCAVAALKGPHKQYYAGKSDSCGVRTHALTDWRLKPAPETTRPNCPGRQLDMSTRLLSSCLQPLTIICPSFGQCPYRLVVRTPRCGRDNPGSTPGEDIAQIHACLRRPTIRLSTHVFALIK